MSVIVDLDRRLGCLIFDVGLPNLDCSNRFRLSKQFRKFVLNFKTVLKLDSGCQWAGHAVESYPKSEPIT